MDLISVEHDQKKAFTVSVRNHEILSDMHIQDGGNDRGMNPIELFCASLGTCIAVFGYDYCVKNDLPSDGIELSIVPQLADNPRRIKSIAVDLSLPDDFPPEKSKAFKKAALSGVITNTLEHKLDLDVEIE